MNCPICEKKLTAVVCDCGYDRSRDYEKYPTFAPVPRGVESIAVLRDRLNNLVRCEDCGGHTFTLNRKTGSLACAGCGRALTAEELKPLTDALGMQEAEPKAQHNTETKPEAVPAEPEQMVSGQTVPLAMPQNLLDVLGKIQEKQADVPESDPNRIVAVSAGDEHTVVLYADGTVAAVGNNREGECNVSEWREIVAVAAGREHTAGLKKDGTVVLAGYCYGNQKDAEKWNDIVAISTGTFHTVGLKKDGTVVCAGDTSGGRGKVSGWKDIKAISAGSGHTLGLDSSGCVCLTGKGTKLPWGGWKRVKAIAAGRYHHSAALTEDGTVLIAGNGGKPAELGGDIVEVAAGFNFTVVRKADGTASISGYCTDGRNGVKKWTDLVQIAAGRDHVVGLKKDGTLVAAGKKTYGRCDVHKLMRT